MSKKTKFKQTEVSKFPEGWEVKDLGEEIELVYGKGLPEKKREFGEYPVFGSNGIIGYHNENLIKGPGVIIGRKGSVGEIKFSKIDFWPIDTTYYIKLKKKGNIKFWYYFLQYLKLNKLNSHSAVPGLNRDQIYQITVKIPNLPEQNAITTILSSLDEKIELNQKMNKTLEAIGQALFKRWFIDFEFPNEEDKPYKSSGGEMVYSEELGKEIPKGWRAGVINDDFELTMGQSPPGKTYNEIGEGIKFFQGRTDFGFRYPTERVYCTAPTRFAQPGDTLVSVRAPVGDINMSLEKCCIGRGLATIRHKTNSRSYTYYSMHMLKKEFERYESEGTVFGSITKKKFLNLKIVIPPTEIIELFESLLYPIDQKIEDNEIQSRTLSNLRDSLLPKLMSGKIRVKIPEETRA